MKKKSLKKTVAVMLSGVCLASGVAVPADTVQASAGLGYWPENLPIPNQYYYQKESLQPYGTCLQIGELKNWSPDNDPDARYNRSSIPLRQRYMGPSVNPLASRDAKVMPLAMSNARASEAESQGGEGDFVYAFNNFQYIDTYNFWGGSSAEGPICIPSPEHIDSAHRNGVQATGTIFIPWGDEEYGGRFVRELVAQDEQGNYPCADKLIEVAQYYGFDGYIFNAESGTGVSGFKEFLAYMQEKAPENFRISWYNGSGTLGADSIDAWMQDEDKRITDERWLDMSGNGNVDSTIDATYEADRDKWDIHSTWEYIPMQDGAKGGDYHTRLDKDGKLKISLGILAPTSTLTQSKNSDDFMNVQDQKLWVGPDFDPSSTNRPDDEFCGFANLVADQTPVLGTDFVTHFNPGNGYKFYENGAVTGMESGWHNRSLTEVLPTWRWIVDAEDGAKKVEPKIDYEDAYWGGASMKISGGLSAGKANHIKLYSTQLDITDSSTFELVYKTKKNSDVKLSVGLCFGDTYEDKNFQFYPVEIQGDGSWKEASIPLADESGQRVSAISLKLESAGGVDDYSMNIGKMGIVTDKSQPEAPGEITLDDVIYPTDLSAEARIYWDKGEHSFIDIIHRVRPDGQEEFVGATPSDAFYIPKFPKLEGEKEATFKITSISENGIEGDSREIKIAWPKEVPDGFGPSAELGENLALRAPAVCDVPCAADGPVDKINDGVIPSSKWCGTANSGSAYLDLGKEVDISRWIVYHANCRGAGEGVNYNTVDFELLYAPDDGKPVLDPTDKTAAERVKKLNYKEADKVTGNKQNVTDRNLDGPIKARYIKLHITDSDNSPWSAIRIYEMELYGEKGEGSVAVPTAPLERNVTVYNEKGNQDKVIIDNVGMPYAEGSYPNGTVNEKTGVVSLYDSMDAKEPIAQVRAQQPDNVYKQYAVGIAQFDNLKLKPEGGRLWYSVQDASTGETVTTQRSSVAYPPEDGKKIPEAQAKLYGEAAGVNLSGAYGALEISGLPKEATVKVYDSKDALKPILHSAPAGEDKKILLESVPLKEEGGTVYYTIHAPGYSDTERLELAYGEVGALPAYQGTLAEMVNMYERGFFEEEYLDSTWGAFASARTKAAGLLEGNPTKAEADAVRMELKQAECGLLKKADKSRIQEVCADYEANKGHYSKESWEKFQPVFEEVKAFAQAEDETDKMTIQTQRVKLDKAARQLVEIVPINSSVIPDEALLKAIKEQTGFESVDQLSTYEGTLDLINLPVKDLTGLEKMEKLKGLILDGTKVKEVNAKNLPKTLETLSMKNCGGLETIDLRNSGMDKLKQADITGCEKLVLVYMNTGNLEKLEVSENGKYANIYALDISGNKLDLSEKTPEGKLAAKVEENLKKNPPEKLEKYTNVTQGRNVTADVMQGRHEKPEVMVDGKKDQNADIYYLDTNGKAVINLGEAKDISKVGATFQKDNFPAEYKWEYSEDGKDYKELAVVKKNEKYQTENTLKTPVKAQYLRFTVLNKGKGEAVVVELEGFEKKTIASGVTSGNQKPEAVVDYKTIPAELSLKQGSEAVDMLDYMKNCYKEVKTVRGTKIAELTDAKWLAKDYDIEAAAKMPEGMKVVITKEDGSACQNPFVPENTGNYTAEYRVGEGKALASVKVKVTADKSYLEELAASCEGKKETDYTPATWAVFQEKLAKAKELLENEFAGQDEIDAAEQELSEALTGLRVKPIKTVLHVFIELAEKELENAADKAPETMDALNTALTEAKTVFENPNATQEEVDAAGDKLLEALNRIRPMADKEKLLNLIARVESMETSGYTDASVKTLEEKLAEAKTVAEDDNAFEEDVELAYNNLLQAVAHLEVKVHTAELEYVIAKAEDILAKKDKYIAATLEGLSEETKKAKEVLEKADATQEEVNQAAADLAWKVGNARLKAEKQALLDMLEEAEKMDVALYTEESARAFTGALLKARQAAEDEYATQAEVDAAVSELDDAMTNLVKAEPEQPETKPEEEQKPEQKPESEPEEEQNQDKGTEEGQQEEAKEEKLETPSHQAPSKKPVSSTRDYAVRSRRQHSDNTASQSSKEEQTEERKETKEETLLAKGDGEENSNKETEDTADSEKAEKDKTVQKEEKASYGWILAGVLILAAAGGLWYWKKKQKK